MKGMVIGGVVGWVVVWEGVGGVEGKSKWKKKGVVEVDGEKNGMGDGWEKEYDLGYGKEVGRKDEDGDGVRNGEEYEVGVRGRK